MLTDLDMLRAWELGEPVGWVGRALCLLGCGFPDRSRSELAALSIGQRDALLLGMREATFGRALRGLAECPACGQGLVFSTTCAALSVPVPSVSWPLALVSDDWVLHIRPPCSHDLAAAAAIGELQAARQELLARCVVSAQRGAEPQDSAALPAPLYALVTAALAEHEPQADVRLTLRCSAGTCGQKWQEYFDIAAYFWTEVAAQARRLMQQVDALARVYGWREADILAMSTVRRQQYLSLASA